MSNAAPTNSPSVFQLLCLGFLTIPLTDWEYCNKRKSRPINLNRDEHHIEEENPLNNREQGFEHPMPAENPEEGCQIKTSLLLRISRSTLSRRHFLSAPPGWRRKKEKKPSVSSRMVHESMCVCVRSHRRLQSSWTFRHVRILFANVNMWIS